MYLTCSKKLTHHTETSGEAPFISHPRPSLPTPSLVSVIGRFMHNRPVPYPVPTPVRRTGATARPRPLATVVVLAFQKKSCFHCPTFCMYPSNEIMPGLLRLMVCYQSHCPSSLKTSRRRFPVMLLTKMSSKKVTKLEAQANKSTIRLRLATRHTQ